MRLVFAVVHLVFFEKAMLVGKLWDLSLDDELFRLSLLDITPATLVLLNICFTLHTRDLKVMSFVAHVGEGDLISLVIFVVYWREVVTILAIFQHAAVILAFVIISHFLVGSTTTATTHILDGMLTPGAL